MIPPEQWSSAWSDHESTTVQQATLAEADLEKWLAGAPHASFDPFRKLLTPICNKFAFSLLEIGCGAGYYLPAFRSFVQGGIYDGVDISPSMIAYARQRYDDIDHSIFTVGDSSELPFVDGMCDCACISGLIQHLADYRPSIKEAARVSRRWVLLHRVEATSGENQEFIRRAYDSDVPTRRVNENELLLFCGLCGLTLRAQEKWSVTPEHWNASYLLEKT